MRVSVGVLVILVACGPGKTVSGEGSGAGSGSGATADGSGAGTDGGSGSGSATPCVPGQVIECPCPGGGTGAQTCEPDGQSFGPCECEGDTGSGSDGTSVPPDGTSSGTSSGTSGEPTCRPPDDPYPGDADIESNDDIATYAGYSVIAGRLMIQGSAVTSLEGLECLTLVGERLSVSNTSLLRDLRGLDNLERIQGELEIGDNTGLESLAGLGALTRVGYLSIYGNSSLATIDDMTALTTVDNAVEVEGNPDLPTCDILVFLDLLDSYASHCVHDNQADDCPDEC